MNLRMMVVLRWRERISCKSTSPCKLWKLQFGPLDQHSREGVQGVGGFAKVWLPNPRAGPDPKITQFSMSLGCWSDDLDWSFHSLHREIGLHLIRSLKYIKSNDQCKIHQSSRNISLLLYSIHILRVIVSFFSSTLQFATTNRKINMAWEETELTTGNRRFP